MSRNPRLHSIPDDDHLRMVVWTGRVVAQSAEFKTPRFAAWLKRIDELGNFVDERVDEVIDSVGAISLFPIGACFMHQQRVDRVDRSPPEILSIKVPDHWEVRRAIDKNPITTQSYISPWDVPLKMTSFQGLEIRGFDAWLVVAETTAGKKVLLPCSEVFRAFYAASSDQAIGIFREPWSKVRTEFLERYEESIDADGRLHWHLDLKKGVPASIARWLSWLAFVPGASQIANQTHTSLVNQKQMGVQPWIRAVPPISEGVLRIQAQTKWLSRSKALLVTQILDFTPDIRVAKITCTIPEKVIPMGGDVKDSKEPKEKERCKPGPIAKPRDRRDTNRYFDLNANSMSWDGLPSPEVTPKEIRRVPGNGSPTLSEKGREVEVSVGGKSRDGNALPAAQITPETAERLRSRFEEVITTLNLLVEWKLIDRWSYFPIYRPIEDMHCSFPVLMPSAEHPKAARWSRVDGNSRVALVLSLEVRGRTIYWIEIEPVPRNFKALVFEMLDGEPLDELTLSGLLEGCANTVGIWDVTLEFARPLKMIAKGHASNREKTLSANVFMGAIAQLGTKSGQPEEAATDNVEASAGQLTEHVALNSVIPH